MGIRKLLGVMDMFITLIIVNIWAYCVQTHQLYTLNMCSLLILQLNVVVVVVVVVVIVQSPSHVWHFTTPWTAAHQASLSLTISLSLPKLMSIESGISSNHLILCHPLLLLPSVFPSIRDLSNELAVHIWWSERILVLQHQSFQWVFKVDFL